MLSLVRAAGRVARPTAVRAYGSGGHSAEPHVGPGAKVGSMPSQVEQATGLERDEYLAALEGKKLFDLEPHAPKHFGTKQNPIVVYTQVGERQVGCQGACPFADEPGWSLWWTMKVGEDARCSECGQYFSLRMGQDAAASQAHH